MNKKIAVLSVSGGMDSTALLLYFLARGFTCHALSFDYGQKHKIELDRFGANLCYLSDHDLAVNAKIADLSSVMSLFHSALTRSDMVVPEGHYADENMKQTVVPNRNAIFSSLLYGWALSLSKEHDVPAVVGLGVHSGDHEIYPDCRPGFYDLLIKAFMVGNWDGEQVTFFLPFLSWDKAAILRGAEFDCKTLGLDFNTVFANTNTCYAPDDQGRACGKCGSCTERLEAFEQIGKNDPVLYQGV